MRTLPATAGIVVLSTLAFVVWPGCHHDTAPVSGNRGVFYKRTTGELVPLFKGSAVEMAPRAVAVGSAVRPSFLVILPDVKPTDVRIAVNLADGKSGAFERVDVTATPMEGKPGSYTVSPKTDLPRGLCAIVVGFDDKLLDDRNNVYPFTIAVEKAAPVAAGSAP